MPELCFPEKLFEPVLHAGVSVALKICQMQTVTLVWIYFSFLTVATANLMSLKSGDTGTGYSHLYEIFLDTTIFISILNQVTMTKIYGKQLKLILKCLLEPFKKYPKHARQFKIIRKYKKTTSICALAMTVFIVIGVIFHSLNPLVAINCSPNKDAIKEWPLPFGKLPMKVYSIWFYGLFYSVSLFCVVVSTVMYGCWFLILVCSTFHMMTKLKLLSLEVKSLIVRAEELCEHRLSLLSRQKRLSIPREEIVNLYSIACLKEVVKGHIKIMRHVRQLENSYRWIVLGYCKASIFITALSLMIMVDEWKVQGSISTVRLNMTISTLFFIFVNSYSGQRIINESENLRVALCSINWIGKSSHFTGCLKIMMTATQKPLCLTAGTVYTLSMESYSKTMEAVYSFVNFLIPLRR